MIKLLKFAGIIFVILFIVGLLQGPPKVDANGVEYTQEQVDADARLINRAKSRGFSALDAGQEFVDKYLPGNSVEVLLLDDTWKSIGIHPTHLPQPQTAIAVHYEKLTDQKLHWHKGIGYLTAPVK